METLHGASTVVSECSLPAVLSTVLFAAIRSFKASLDHSHFESGYKLVLGSKYLKLNLTLYFSGASLLLKFKI